MANWADNGDMSGYDPLSFTNADGIFQFATPGTTVDLASSPGAGITRQGWGTNSDDDIRLQIPYTFEPEDLDNQPDGWQRLSVGAYFAEDSLFPEGVIPTPTDIVHAVWQNWGDERVANTVGQTSWTSLASTNTHTYEPFGRGPGSFINDSKYWVAVTPVRLRESGVPDFSRDYVRMLQGVDRDAVSRGISFWTNQKPRKPVITSPAPGTVIVPGGTVNLTYEPHDPDELTPDDEHRYNKDLAAVRFQYAPVPTPENPDPQWNILPIYDSYGSHWEGDNLAQYARGDGGGAIHSEYRAFMIDDLSIPVLGGYDGSELGEGEPKTAFLPVGEWQLRVRTFDWGNAYPGTENPLGANLDSSTKINLDNYPERNTSPWSDPVRVIIPGQVPPPLAEHPSRDIAVEGHAPVTLAWDYRNAHDPPKEQIERIVQMREVGSGDPWTTILYDISPDETATVPPETPPVDTGPTEYLTDRDFEGGTTGEWSDGPSHFGYPLPTNETVDSELAHSGTHVLQVEPEYDSSLDSWRSNFILRLPVADLEDEHLRFRFDGWARPQDANIFSAVLQWEDAQGGPAGQSDPDRISANYVASMSASSALGTWEGYPNGWIHLNEWSNDNGNSLEYLLRPPDAEYLLIQIEISRIDGIEPAAPWLDDVSLIGYAVSGQTGFTMEPTTNYEWRIKVTDTDAVESNYSEPARFWVVEPAQSGDTVPVPDETIEGATLGCGTHRVYVHRRGGRDPIGEIRNISRLDWERVRDDISTAKITVSGWDIDCGTLLSLLQTWAYELVIFRDNGFSIDRVWEGPIILLTYERDTVTIQGKDVMAYPYRRIMRQEMSDIGSGNGRTVVRRAKEVVQNALAPDDPNLLAYLRVIHRSDDAMQYRHTPPYSRTAFEEVDDMAANAGLDYTAVGRAILLWGTKNRIGKLPELRDGDLGSSPIVSEYGMSMANRYAVSDGNGVYGVADRLNSEGRDPTYGLVEMLSSSWASDSEEDTGTYTQEGLASVRESFRESSERSISDRYPPPVVVRVPENTTLHPDAVISIQHLVPGVVIPLRSTGTLRTVAKDQKLDSIRVIEEAGKETISITVSPFSQDDSEVAEEEEGDE